MPRLSPGRRSDGGRSHSTAQAGEKGTVDRRAEIHYTIHRNPMKLSTKSEYACLAMIVLAEDYGKKKLCTIGEIARRKSIPKKYLEQILLILKRSGHVKSYKGPGGGYKLAKTPRRITVAQIVRLMDGALAPVESASKYFFEHTPIEKSPKLIAVLRSIRNYISDTLEKLSFDDLIER
jgi:Rrf2 family cysteine metabolism transcriptional repressor